MLWLLPAEGDGRLSGGGGFSQGLVIAITWDQHFGEKCPSSLKKGLKMTLG